VCQEIHCKSQAKPVVGHLSANKTARKLWQTLGGGGGGVGVRLSTTIQ
jgi:hypothetical protein